MGRCEYCTRPTTKNKDNVSFHRFPTDIGISNIWIANMGKVDWKPRKDSVLCSTHFTKDCFDRMTRTRLRKGSIPTIFHPLAELISINEMRMLRALERTDDPLYIDNERLETYYQFGTIDSNGLSRTFETILQQPRVPILLPHAGPLANPETVQHDHQYADTLSERGRPILNPVKLKFAAIRKNNTVSKQRVKRLKTNVDSNKHVVSDFCNNKEISNC